jgi:hypothetical protein
MPIIYRHEMKDRNQPKAEEPKYPKRTWVSHEGKQWQVTGFRVEDGRRIYDIKAPTADGFGEIKSVDQWELSEPNAIAITDSDRQANRERVMSDAARYQRD